MLGELRGRFVQVSQLVAEQAAAGNVTTVGNPGIDPTSPGDDVAGGIIHP